MLVGLSQRLKLRRRKIRCQQGARKGVTKRRGVLVVTRVRYSSNLTEARNYLDTCRLFNRVSVDYPGEGDG